tara:strand:- start:732 stop:899 length:168 start_codon:yes stop_codon:yes gene_type:complete
MMIQYNDKIALIEDLEDLLGQLQMNKVAHEEAIITLNHLADFYLNNLDDMKGEKK